MTPISAWTQERRPATTPAAPSPPAGTGGVLAAEELRVAVEGNTHRVGLDYRATEFGVSPRQPHGNASQVRHYVSVDSPHPREDNLGETRRFSDWISGV